MATGHPTVDALALTPCPAAAGNLIDAEIDLPAAFDLWAGGETQLGRFSSLADPRPCAFSKSGYRAQSHDAQWFDRIHVVPRAHDLGAAISAMTIEAEVWNAWMSRARILSEITIEGPAGIEVVNPFTLPYSYAASKSSIFQVAISLDGDPQIENLVTWIFLEVPSWGSTDLTLTGYRIRLWPFQADGSEPIRERYGYKTEILVARDGTEQRRQLRARPRGNISFLCMLLATREVQHANALLQGCLGSKMAVPRWQYVTPLAALAAAGQREIQVDTTDVPWRVDGLGVLWRDPFRREVFKVAEVQSDRIVAAFDLQNSWAAPTTQVIPLALAYPSKREGFAWLSLDFGSTRLSFDAPRME